MMVFWGYFIELMLAGISYALLITLFGGEVLVAFFKKTWVAWLSVGGLVFAAAIAMLVLVVQMMTSDFGGYLTARSRDGAYKKAYGFAVFVSFLTLIAFVIAGNVDSDHVVHVAGLLLLLMGVNVYTMIRNAFNLQRMHALFEKIRRHEQPTEPTPPTNGAVKDD